MGREELGHIVGSHDRTAELAAPKVTVAPEKLLEVLEGWTLDKKRDSHGPVYLYSSSDESDDEKLGIKIDSKGVDVGRYKDLGLLARPGTGRFHIPGEVRVRLFPNEIEFNTDESRYRFRPADRFATFEIWDRTGEVHFGVVSVGKPSLQQK